MKKFIKILLIVLALSFIDFKAFADCNAFEAQFVSNTHAPYGVADGSFKFKKCNGEIGALRIYVNGQYYDYYNEDDFDPNNCQWITISNLGPGYYELFFREDAFCYDCWKICDEYYAFNIITIHPCPVILNNQTTLPNAGCSDGSILVNFDNLGYFYSTPSAYANNLTIGGTYYGQQVSSTSYLFNGLPSGNYSISFSGYAINNPNPCTITTNVNLPGNPCQVSASIDKADAIANCVNGSMVISTTDLGTYAYHVANLYDAASNLIRTKTFYSDKTDFDNVIPGNYTVEVRTFTYYNSPCYCSDTKPVTISSGGPLFYSPATTATDVGAHGCTNGKVRVDFNNVNDAYYLNYWNIPYKARYTAYLYDANWNIVTSANNLYTGYEFTELAPGNYNVLTVGTRYDAQGCNTPVWTNAIINQPSCITFDILSSTNTTTRCADDGTITASFTNWEGACDGYINLYKVAGTETLIDSWQIGDGALPATWSGLQSSLVFNRSYRVEAHAGDCTISQNLTVGVPACNVIVSAVGSNTSGCTGNIYGSISNACALKTIALFRGANPITTLTTTDNNYNFEGLPSGTYTVSVTASDNLSGCTATATTKVKNANCPVPANIIVTQTPAGGKNAVISWDNYPCAMSYNIQVRIVGMSNWNNYQVPSNTKTLKDVFKNIVYEYRVRTNCSPLYSSAYSSIQTFCFGNCGSRTADVANQTTVNDLKIYPNPAADYVFIESGMERTAIKSVTVFDQTGRLVLIDKTIDDGIIKINTNNFTEGIYFIQLVSVEGLKQGKFVIQK